MAERKGQTVAANKIAMSRALGAAFLNHQVEQLEKSVANGPGSGNWRDRKWSGGQTQTTTINNSPPRRGVVPVSHNKHNRRNKSGDSNSFTKEVEMSRSWKDKNFPELNPKRASVEVKAEKPEKDADVVVVDASVLIHGIDQLKKWSRAGREEVIIVPLEALNTLDLLKKGTSTLAQRARTASRILEAQVGPNPRIRVQRDDAFVLWDQIAFEAPQDGADADKALNASPEWLRRTICCARWEFENGSKTLPNADQPVKIVFAVCTTANQSPLVSTIKLSDTPENPLTPVPLPAPTHVHNNKHEPRSSGTLVAHWATRAGITLLDVKPSPVGPPPNASEDERSKRGPGKGRRGAGRNPSPAENGLVERSPAVLAMMEMCSQPTKVRLLARGEKLDP